jgi:hypothetical protein
MQFTIVLFSFLLFSSCDLINPKSEYSNAYVVFTVENQTFDSRDWIFEFNNLGAYIETFDNQDFIWVTLDGLSPHKDRKTYYPFNLGLSLRTYYDGSTQIEIPSNDNVLIGNSLLLPFRISESGPDYIIQRYNPIEAPNNQITIRIADTLGGKYAIGTIHSAMKKNRPNDIGLFPETFTLTNGSFFVELEDLRN